MIGLSPLPTGHTLRFQPTWVRPSTGAYPRFSLPMGSSPGFASTTRDYVAVLKTRFRCGSLHSLTSPRIVTLWLILHNACCFFFFCAPTARGRAVSGAVSLPSRGAFHLSLAVLVRYRSRESVQPWRVVPPASHRVSRVRQYSGATRQPPRIRVRGSNPVSPAFPGRSASTRFCNCTMSGPTTPPAPKRLAV